MQDFKTNQITNSLGVFAIIAITMIFFSTSINAQMEGSINYVEKIKFDIQIEGLDDAMLDMIPKSQDLNKQLLFNKNESLYINMKGEVLEDTEMESDDGSFKIMILRDDSEEIMYHSFADKKVVHQKGIMGKSFVVEEPMSKQKWKMTNEKVKYLGYECTKAVIENEDDFIVAWFTSELPLQIGPSVYNGLPGAILMVNVNEGELEIKATKVNLESLDGNVINQPNEGKKVTEEEFEKIRKEKEAELQESYQGGRH